MSGAGTRRSLTLPALIALGILRPSVGSGPVFWLVGGPPGGGGLFARRG